MSKITKPISRKERDRKKKEAYWDVVDTKPNQHPNDPCYTKYYNMWASITKESYYNEHDVY